jgi:hypothetical protein
MRPLATSIVLLVGIAHLAVAVQAREYCAGQVWTYHVRPGDEGSTLQINKVESDQKLGSIFHISLFGLHLGSFADPGSRIAQIARLPVSKATLDASVIALTFNPARSVAFEEGYSLWRQAFDSGRAGIYTIPVADIISTAANTMSKPQP